MRNSLRPLLSKQRFKFRFVQCDAPSSVFASLEKKARTASERSRPDVVARRAYTRTKIMPVLPVERAFFIDETGADLSCERATAWGPIGARVVVKSPANRGKRLSVINALTLEGKEAVDLYEGTLTGERFYSWVQLHLAPLIRPRDVVIQDNASMHVHTEALALIESKGAFVFFLPPYSPDMNPIEEAWSKVKAHLRAQAARTKDVLREAIKTAIKSITRQDILGWFTHAG